jgi:DNA-binding HxlR family transcriptional regulator
MARQQLYQPETLSTPTILGDDWSIKVVNALAQNRLRFSILQHTLGMSSKTLSKRLKELEANGMITRTLYAQVPLRVEYELTEKGFEFKGILDEIVKWEKKWK